MEDLSEDDLVIIDKEWNFLRFSDGTIIIYNDYEEAKRDCIEGVAVFQATLLPEP